MATRNRARKQPELRDRSSVRVAIYTRRSTDDEHQPFSIEAQIARLEAYVASQPGWQITARFTDDASGSTLDRPGLQKAVLAAQAGRYDMLLVYRLDRLTRRSRDLAYLMEELEKIDVHFRSVTEPFDTSSAAGRMLVQMLGVFAEFEREVLIDRTRNGMERKAAKGKWTGGPIPYGYDLNRQEDIPVPHPTEAALVRQIFTAYALTASAPALSPTSSINVGSGPDSANPGPGSLSATCCPTGSTSATRSSETSASKTRIPPSSVENYSQKSSRYSPLAARLALGVGHPTPTMT